MKAGDLSEKRLWLLAQYAFTRLDGAWFLVLARELGKETAWKMDVEVWRQFSYVFGKRIRQELESPPVWPQSFLQALEILARIMGIAGREVIHEGESILVRARDCEIQRAIAKAGIADCGIATATTYRGLARGLFGKETDLKVEHLKNMNQGADCCEVRVWNPTASPQDTSEA